MLCLLLINTLLFLFFMLFVTFRLIRSIIVDLRSFLLLLNLDLTWIYTVLSLVLIVILFLYFLPLLELRHRSRIGLLMIIIAARLIAKRYLAQFGYKVESRYQANFIDYQNYNECNNRATSVSSSIVYRLKLFKCLVYVLSGALFGTVVLFLLSVNAFYEGEYGSANTEACYVEN